MKKYINGEYIEMTEEEIVETQRLTNEDVTPTLLERIEAIEGAILEGVLSNG